MRNQKIKKGTLIFLLFLGLVIQADNIKILNKSSYELSELTVSLINSKIKR